jgi:uncharacterized protein (TIGR03032 family)
MSEHVQSADLAQAAQAPALAAPTGQPIKISCTRGLAAWLIRHNATIAFTSYQSGRLYLVGVDPQERVSFHERYFARAMGLWADPQRILVATLYQLWRLENVLGADQRTSEGADRHYVPRVAHTTGDLDIHDIGVMADGRIVFVNTSFSCLALLSPTHSFRAMWKPPFISRLAPEDRCHLNGLAMRDGAPAYVTAVSRSDIVNGWRDRRAEGGSLIDVATNRVVTANLSMPHSPRIHQDRLYVLNSGTGHLGTIDAASGAFTPIAFCPGFLRGLALHGGYALVGLSLPRDGSFAGLVLDGELKKRDAEPWCGVQIVELATGNIVEWIRLEGGVSELFDVQVIPGVRHATCTGILTDEIQRLVTFEIEGPATAAAAG